MIVASLGEAQDAGAKTVVQMSIMAIGKGFLSSPSQRSQATSSKGALGARPFLAPFSNTPGRSIMLEHMQASRRSHVLNW